MITIKEVAELAGVSKATVSRVLNNSGYVSVEVRKKVEDIIRECGASATPMTLTFIAFSGQYLRSGT